MECGDRAARPWQNPPTDVYADCRWTTTTDPLWAVATWQFDPLTYPDAADSTIVVLAQETGCTGASLPVARDAEVRPILRIAGDEIVVMILVEVTGYGDCIGPNPVFPVSVDLGAPLGDRLVFDGRFVPPSLKFPPPPPHPRMSSSFAAPDGVIDAIAGYGSLWVAGFGVVVRRDAVTEEVLATVDTPGTDFLARLAVGYGSVWVSANDGKVYRINPATNRVSATIDIGGNAHGVAVGGGSVWITAPNEPPSGELIRIDAVTNQIVGDPIEVGPGPGPVVFASGSAWVSNTSPPSLVRVDPVSGDVVTMGSGGRLLMAAGSLWAAANDEVVRIDPESGRTLATISIPAACLLTANDTAVLVVGCPEATGETATLWMIDSVTNLIIGQPVPVDGPQPIAIAAFEEFIWIVDYTNMWVQRFDLVP